MTTAYKPCATPTDIKHEALAKLSRMSMLPNMVKLVNKTIPKKKSTIL